MEEGLTALSHGGQVSAERYKEGFLCSNCPAKGSSKYLKPKLQSGQLQLQLQLWHTEPQPATRRWNAAVRSSEGATECFSYHSRIGFPSRDFVAFGFSMWKMSKLGPLNFLICTLKRATWTCLISHAAISVSSTLYVSFIADTRLRFDGAVTAYDGGRLARVSLSKDKYEKVTTPVPFSVTHDTSAHTHGDKALHGIVACYVALGLVHHQINPAECITRELLYATKKQQHFLFALEILQKSSGTFIISTIGLPSQEVAVRF